MKNKEEACSTCGGTGLVPSALACMGISVELCSVCNGSGKITLESNKEE